MKIAIRLASILALAACTPPVVDAPASITVTPVQPVAKPLSPLKKTESLKSQKATGKTNPALAAPSASPKTATPLVVADVPTYTGGGRSQKKVTVELY